MSIGSLTLSIAISIALVSVIAASAWVIDDELDDRRDLQTVLSIALAYRDHMTASRCTLTSTPLMLRGVRRTLTTAGQNPAFVGDESSWRLAFEGGSNRQSAVTVYHVDTNGKIENALTYTLPVPGGDRTHEFFDAVFDSRICP